jgi:succinyl-diaminopimelate desuccinylase
MDVTTVEQEIIELTEDLVRFRSTKNNPDEIEKCIDYIAEYFSDGVYVVRRFERNGKPSLLVSFEETMEPEVLLHGHIDVIEADEEMFEPRVEGSKLHGRGTADMKAGVAAIMTVMEAVRDTKPSVGLLIVSDEELGGFDGVNYLLEEKGLRPSFAISAEPNNMDGYLDIVTHQKGILQVEVTAEGRSAHGSRPWKGENAAEKLMEKYNEINDLFEPAEQGEWTTTVNLGRLEAGESTNKVPERAEMHLDIRYAKSYPSEEVLADLRSIEGIDIEASLDEPMLHNDNGNTSIQNLRSVAEDVAGECTVTRKEPGSDMRFMTEKDIPAVVFGPEGYNAHAPDEYAVIDSFDDYFEIVRRFVLENA